MNNIRFAGAVLAIATILTACGKENTNIFPGEEDTSRMTIETGTTTEAATDTVTETTAESAGTGETLSTEETSNVVQKQSMPDFADLTKEFYDDATQGKELVYEYDEEQDRWYCVFKYNDVSLKRLNSVETELEYNGKKIKFEWGWHIELAGTGSGMNLYMRDVTGDGKDELILYSYTRECSSVSIFDLENWTDITPYYSAGADLSLWLDNPEEIISQVNEQAANDGYSDEYAKASINKKNGALILNFLKHGEQIVRADINDDNSITVKYAERAAMGEMSLTFDFDYSAADGRYVYRDMQVSTKAGRLREDMGKAQTTHESMQGSVEVVSPDDMTVRVTYGKSDVTVWFDIALNDSLSGREINVTKADRAYNTGWTSADNLDNSYFELRDMDNDGNDELVYYKYSELHVDMNTVETKVETLVYDFETESIMNLQN